MEVTNNQILNAQAGIKELMPLQMPGRITARILTLAEELDKDATTISTARFELAKKYGEVKGDKVIIPPDHPEVAKFQQEIADLLDDKRERHYESVSLAATLWLNANISAQAQIWLRGFVTFEQEPEKKKEDTQPKEETKPV